MLMCVDRTERVPRILETDDLMAFGPAFKMVFGRLVGPRPAHREGHIRNRRYIISNHELSAGTPDGARGLENPVLTLVADGLPHCDFARPCSRLDGRPRARHGNGVFPYALGDAGSACAKALWYVVLLCALWRPYGPWSLAWQ